MAYQNVGTPRFYVNILEWLTSNDVNAINLIDGATWDSSVWNTLPVNPADYHSNIIEDGDPTDLSFPTNVLTPYSFLAILGHDLKTNNPEYGMYIQSEGLNIDTQNVVNSFSIGQQQGTIYNGFSIGTFNGIDMVNLHILATGKVGSMIIGTYYDMPNAPNLSLTINREYGGTKEFTTHNGSTMSNTMWSKPSMWGNLGAWELDDGNPTLSRLAKSGRRSWDLEFSYMDDGDLWGSNQSITNEVGGTLSQSEMDLYDDGDLYSNTTFQHTLLSNDNFFSQVWHKTLGGTLPFIFQPDSNNNNPDQFAICKFKNNSLKATQSAFNVYDISLSIEEVW